MNVLDKVREFEFPKVCDPRGNLSFIEEGCHVPFSIKRVFYIYDVPGGVTRGAHAHKEQLEVVIAISGAVDLYLSNGKEERIYRLDRSNRGVLIPPGVWVSMHNFTTGTVLLALSNIPYDEADYIRDFDEYKKYVETL